MISKDITRQIRSLPAAEVNERRIVRNAVCAGEDCLQAVRVIIRDDHMHHAFAADAHEFIVGLLSCHALFESAERQTALTAEQIKIAVPADDIARSVRQLIGIALCCKGVDHTDIRRIIPFEPVMQGRVFVPQERCALLRIDLLAS